jgi:hypothetical protein
MQQNREILNRSGTARLTSFGFMGILCVTCQRGREQVTGKLKR